MKQKQMSILLAAMLLLGLVVPARAAGPPNSLRVSSYKGGSLKIGERSGLVISPGGTEYTVSSSNPDMVAVEQVLSFWVAVAKAEGKAEITAVAPDGQTGSVTISVEPTESAKTDEAEDTTSAYSEVRLELVRLINQTRTANGVLELPINEALMSAAQFCSDSRYTWHHTKEECEAVIASGYSHGFGINLTVFTGVAAEDTAQHAIDNWLNSPGHFETMIQPDCDGIGVGVTESDGATYCYMIVGRPNTHNPYE